MDLAAIFRVRSEDVDVVGGHVDDGDVVLETAGEHLHDWRRHEPRAQQTLGGSEWDRGTRTDGGACGVCRIIIFQ